MPSCRKCEAPVLLLKHERTGNTSAIDPEPVQGGNITVDPVAGTYRIVPKEERRLSPHRVLHTSHVVTCPQGPVAAKVSQR